MSTKRCPSCNSLMSGTTHVNKTGDLLITHWLCTACLRREHSSGPNPHYTPIMPNKAENKRGSRSSAAYGILKTRAAGPCQGPLPN